MWLLINLKSIKKLIFLFFFWISVIWALQDDVKQPMQIEADEVEVRENEHTSIYVGQVHVDQGSMRLRANHVTVYHREDRRPRLIIALGNPVYYHQVLDNQQGELDAFAKRMEYDADKDELTLIGEARLNQGKDHLASDRILYDRAHAQVRAGGGRVHITITPQKK